jgi:transcriptional regulator with XRE-family HTH domain
MARAEPDRALGNVLRRLRNESGLSQESLAYRSGITTPTLARIELGQSSPAYTTVSAIAQALGVSMQDVVAQVEAEHQR